MNPKQMEAIRLEIATTSGRIRAARQAGRKEFRDLNERLRQHLTPEHQTLLPRGLPRLRESSKTFLLCPRLICNSLGNLLVSLI